MATMAAAMSSCWRRQEWAVDDSMRAGGERRRRRMQGQVGGNVYARRAGSGQHDERGGAEGVGQGEREADDRMRGGRGWMRHVVGRLDIVPYIGTFVQYDGTFWRVRLRSDARRVREPDRRVRPQK